MRHELNRSSDQRGAVLVVSLLMLLVLTFVGFSSMETSNLQSKMATSRELKELTFQTAEAVIEEVLDNLDYISTAYAIGLQNSNDWPTMAHTFSYNSYLNGSSEVRFMNNANSLGYSIRKGASGIATYYYQVESTAIRSGTNISSTHTQGIYVEGPSLN